MDAAAETGRNPVSKHDQIHPGLGKENGEADAGWNCQTRLGRPNSQERQGNVMFTFPVQLTMSRSADHEQNLDTYSVMCEDHTHIIYSRLSEYCERVGILPEGQSGFRSIEPFYHRYDVCNSSATGAGAGETNSALCMLYRPYQSIRLR